MITRIIGNHRFKRRDVFTTKAEAKKYIENARSYGEQVRTIKTAKGYEIWARVGDYQIR